MRIRLLQSVKFTDKKDVAKVQRSIVVKASTTSQNVPDWIENDPIFEMLEDSGHLEIVQSTAAAKRTPLIDAGKLGLGGTDEIRAREEAAANAATANATKPAPTVIDAAQTDANKARLAEIAKQTQTELANATKPADGAPLGATKTPATVQGPAAKTGA